MTRQEMAGAYNGNPTGPGSPTRPWVSPTDGTIYRYNAFGDVETATTADGQHAWSYEYDSYGRLTNTRTIIHPDPNKPGATIQSDT